MSFQVILVIHVLLALGMVGLILIQHGKGAGAGAGFGSGAAGTVFGARGANSFLYKLTAAMALGFFITNRNHISAVILAGIAGTCKDRKSASASNASMLSMRLTRLDNCQAASTEIAGS